MVKKVFQICTAAIGVSAIFLVSSASTFAAENKVAVQALYEKAKSEGEVIIWGPTVAELAWIQPALAKRFPGIKVKYNADLRSAPKIIAESRAGKTSLDVFVFSLGGVLAVQRRKLLGTTNWAAFGTKEKDTYFGGQAGATHNIIYSVMYNKNLVKAADLPGSWAEFTDTKWKDKLVASPFLLPRLTGFLAMEWGEERSSNWLRDLIGKNNIMITNAPRQGILSSGERPISITDFASVSQRLARGGAPTQYKMLDIIPAVQFCATPMKGAPHPNASKFVSAWLTTPEASAAREAFNFAASIGPGADTARAKEVNSLSGKVIVERPQNMKVRAGFYKKLSPIVTGRKK